MTREKNRFTKLQWLAFAAALLIFILFSATTVYAAGDVAGAIENTWSAAKSQIKTVVNNVVFPVIDMILAVLFFVKIGTAYMDYRKHGQFEFTVYNLGSAPTLYTVPFTR